MAIKHGVYTSEQATSISTPVVAESGIPFVVGTAPVHMATNPAKTNVPVLLTSWDEAVEQFGFSYDWNAYTLCEFMYSHFQLFGCQPVLFCNVLDPDDMKTAADAQSYEVSDHKITLPFNAIHKTIVVTLPTEDGEEEEPTAAASSVSDAVSTYLGAKEDLTGCTMDFDEDANTLTVTLTGDASEVKNTGLIDTLTALIEDGCTVTLDGESITGLSDLATTDAYTKIAVMAQGDEDLVFTLVVSKDGEDETYTLTVSYPSEAATASEEGEETTTEEETSATTTLVEDEDYTVEYDYDDEVCTIELLDSGAAYDVESLTISYSVADASQVTTADIVNGLSAVDQCMNRTGTIPDIICCPGWSHLTTVASVMATKAESISGLFGARALIDFDTGEDGVRSYTDLYEVKNQNNFVDETQILCWPKVTYGDYVFHMSTQLAGLMASVDTDNDGVPYESPSNKNFKMDGCVLDDGTEINLTHEQANVVNGYGVVTALNFMSMGWVCWGNYNACYPSNTDVKDYFIPISRMFDWVASTLIQTFWSKIDKPMNRMLLDTITNTTNIWLDGLTGSGYLLGARAEILDSENTDADIMAGIIHIHIYITPPSPMQECDFILEYDVDNVAKALL